MAAHHQIYYRSYKPGTARALMLPVVS